MRAVARSFRLRSLEEFSWTGNLLLPRCDGDVFPRIEHEKRLEETVHTERGEQREKGAAVSE
jgi:hypothetical protein